MGFLADGKARREAAKAAAAAEREASAREKGLTAEELARAWREWLESAGVDTADVRGVVDAGRGMVFRPSLDMSATTSMERGFMLVTGSGQLVLAFRGSSSDGVAPPVEVIVRSVTEVREPRRKEDRSLVVVFEGDRLFRPPNNPMYGDAWELRHADPDELHRHLSSIGLPW